MLISAVSSKAATLSETIDGFFKPIVDNYLVPVIFWDPIKAMGFDVGADVPIVVVWLVFGAVYFTFRMNFINFRGFKHAIGLVKGDYDDPNDKGEVSHFQALTTALSATVGLGNIAGVAIAISIGGPGATFWMIVAGLLGMSAKFVECTLGVKYRKLDENGEVSGGPMYYLRDGLAKYNMAGFGKVLAVLFAILCIGGSFGGGNMFQANQAYAQVAGQFPVLADSGPMFGLILAILVGTVIVGGIKSIANVTEKIVPFMAALYVGTALIIILLNITEIGNVFALIFKGAFTPAAGFGGIIGVLIQGFRRAAFSNEAGIGSAAIAHSAVKTNYAASEGFVAMVGPFVDTVIVCLMTSLVLIFTGYADGESGATGAKLTSMAFESVFSWYGWVLLVAILLFSFSTMISWSYYGLKAWQYVFGDSKFSSTLYKLLFLLFVVVGASSSLGTVMDFSDLMILAMAVPNILALYILLPKVKEELNKYWAKVSALK